jgi:protein-disulfide isomerase
MKPRAAVLALLAAAALPLAATATAKAPARQAPRPDWTRTFAVTPEGGFRMGNPEAKIAIVEYGSLTCPHCRHFAQTGVTPLIQKYVRSGKASYEYRSLILNGVDLAATLVARCEGPERFFPTAASLYAKQPAWVAKVEKLPDSERDRLQSLPPTEMMTKVAEIAGIIPLAAANGIAPERARQCLKDEAAANRLAEMYQAALDAGVEGTPTFFVNGKHVAAIDWPTLEPLLKGGGG